MHRSRRSASRNYGYSFTLLLVALIGVAAPAAETDPVAASNPDPGTETTAASPARPAEDKFWQALLLLGDPDEKKQQQGRRLLREAADRENVVAQAFLGERHLDGSAGFPKNPRRAVDWFRLAAGAGYAPAQVHLGTCLATGVGTRPDQELALKWLREVIANPTGFQPLVPPAWFLTAAPEYSVDVGNDLPPPEELLLATAHLQLGQVLVKMAQPTEALVHFETAARFGLNQRAGLADAARQAALAHALGRGTPRNFSQANRFLELSRSLRQHRQVAITRRTWPVDSVATEDLENIEAAAQQLAHVELQADLQEVAASLVRENPAEAVRWCTLAAESGEAWAMVQLAEIYGTAKGDLGDAALAFAWWQRAAHRTNLPLAWANVAVCLQRGLGTAPDAARAREILEQYRRDNFMCELALIGEAPPGEDLSFAAWQTALRRAAVERKRPGARYYYARAVFDAPKNVALRQQGKTPPDIRKIVLPNLKAAADANVPEAQFLLGMFYEHGLAGKADPKKARELLERGMAAGSSACAMELGIRALNGAGEPLDLDRAASCFEKAIALEPTHADAFNNLGVVYAKRFDPNTYSVIFRAGKTIRIQLPEAQAEAWRSAMLANYRRAHELGSAFGAFNLAELTYHGSVLAKDPVAAAAYYQAAADRGHVIAHRMLGRMHERGEGVPVSLSEALYHYRTAALQGDLPALRAVCDFYVQGRGTAVDYEQAKLWFTRLAVAGDLAGVVRFGDMLHRQERYAEELNFWQELLDRKELDLVPGYARDRLSVLYAQGLGAPADPVRAKQYADEAIRLDNIDAFSRRARRLMAENKPDEARKYLDVEWRRASAEFLYLRGLIELWETPSHPANPRGWDLLQRAAKDGSLEARLRLAQAVANREREVLSPEQALEYARAAAAAGLTGATELIPELESRRGIGSVPAGTLSRTSALSVQRPTAGARSAAGQLAFAF